MIYEQGGTKLTLCPLVSPPELLGPDFHIQHGRRRLEEHIGIDKTGTPQSIPHKHILPVPGGKVIHAGSIPAAHELSGDAPPIAGRKLAADAHLASRVRK